MIRVYTKREFFKKYIYVTFECGNCTNYYYTMGGLINKLKEEGNDTEFILEVCQYIRRKESKIRFLKWRF